MTCAEYVHSIAALLRSTICVNTQMRGCVIMLMYTFTCAAADGYSVLFR